MMNGFKALVKIELVVSKSKKDLGFMYNTTLEDGLKSLIEWRESKN